MAGSGSSRSQELTYKGLLCPRRPGGFLQTLAMWCRLDLRKFSQKPAGFVSAAYYAMGVEIRKHKGNVTDCEFHTMEIGRDLSASKASKVDIREQLPWAVPPLWHLTRVLWTVPQHDFPLCNGKSGVLHTEGSQERGWCWFTV